MNNSFETYLKNFNLLDYEPSGEKYGYVRISSKTQNCERQIEKMQELGIPKRNIFIDVYSGRTLDRPHYNRLRKKIRQGDVMYIDTISRLGRNWPELISEYNFIVHEIHADVASLASSEQIMSSIFFRSLGELGRLVEQIILQTLAFCADIQRKQMLEAQAEGIQVAKNNHVKFGRPTIDDSKIEMIRFLWNQRQYSLQEISSIVSISYNTALQIIQLHESGISFEDISEQSKLGIDLISRIIELESIRKYSIRQISSKVGVAAATVKKYTNDTCI